MPDQATPNLPARDFAATERCYAGIGFKTTWRDSGWMIVKRGGLTLEFFPYPDLDPATSSFSCCLRVDDLGALYAACVAAGIEDKRVGWPRLHPPRVEASGLTIAYLVDPDGTLLRLIENRFDD
jgi:catechol 2,3-dioxygenase-like lactoylglutathione lyase family enzyme